jgi:hypothetical protein
MSSTTLQLTALFPHLFIPIDSSHKEAKWPPASPIKVLELSCFGPCVHSLVADIMGGV